MNVFLMHRDRDFDERAAPPFNAKDLVKDLELRVLLDAMAGGNELIREVCEKAILCSVMDADTIRYRQQVLADGIGNPAAIRAMYDLIVETLERRRKSWYGFFAKTPSSILLNAVGLIHLLTDMLRKLRGIAEAHAPAFRSEGLLSLVRMLMRELSDEYLGSVQTHVAELRFRSGVLQSARLGDGNVSADFVLRKPQRARGWLQRLVRSVRPSFGFKIAPRDDGGARAVGEMKDQALNTVANALAQSADHIIGFFTMLRTELAFYVGCLNLHEQLAAKRQSVCFPDPVEENWRAFACRGLCDAALALTIDGSVVGSDVTADGKDVAFITGPNQGGKSTFLRSVGIAQLMMQCGMYVTAESFKAGICHGMFTHYKREEDATMTHGKFSEVLQRMSLIVNHLRKHSLVLFNESFAATNEREGSEIARQIVTALQENSIKVMYVTHMYELAHGFRDRNSDGTIFLRAGRQSDGTRTFKISEGEPLQTSFGKDLYDKLFATGEKASLQMQ